MKRLLMPTLLTLSMMLNMQLAHASTAFDLDDGPASPAPESSPAQQAQRHRPGPTCGKSATNATSDPATIEKMVEWATGIDRTFSKDLRQLGGNKNFVLYRPAGQTNAYVNYQGVSLTVRLCWAEDRLYGYLHYMGMDYMVRIDEGTRKETAFITQTYPAGGERGEFRAVSRQGAIR